MEIQIIDGQLGLSGKDLQFINEPLFGLQPGSEVARIGNGKENGVIRTDSFLHPVRYEGSILVKFSNSKPEEKMFAFKIQHFNDAANNHYFLYGASEYEMFTEAIYSVKDRSSYVRFYKPEFTLN